jgi:hypothetical protein
LGYLVGIVLVSALVSPWVYAAVQWLAVAADLDWLGEQPFRRVFNRVILVVALAGIWPLRRLLAIRSGQQAGWVRDPSWWRHFLAGYLLGILSLGCAVLLVICLRHKAIDFNRTPLELLAALGRYLLVGLVVAVIEETFFRGYIQGTLQRTGNHHVALVVTSAVYSFVHFLKTPWNKPVDWWSGFDYVGTVLARVFTRPDVMVGFVTLFLVGCILGVAFQRTRTLYLAVGLHAGWVLTNEFCRWLTKSQRFGQIRDYWESWPVLLVVLALVIWFTRRHATPSTETSSPCATLLNGRANSGEPAVL